MCIKLGCFAIYHTEYQSPETPRKQRDSAHCDKAGRQWGWSARHYWPTSDFPHVTNKAYWAILRVSVSNLLTLLDYITTVLCRAWNPIPCCMTKCPWKSVWVLWLDILTFSSVWVTCWSKCIWLPFKTIGIGGWGCTARGIGAKSWCWKKQHTGTTVYNEVFTPLIYHLGNKAMNTFYYLFVPTLYNLLGMMSDLMRSPEFSGHITTDMSPGLHATSWPAEQPCGAAHQRSLSANLGWRVLVPYTWHLLTVAHPVTKQQKMDVTKVVSRGSFSGCCCPQC